MYTSFNSLRNFALFALQTDRKPVVAGFPATQEQRKRNANRGFRNANAIGHARCNASATQQQRKPTGLKPLLHKGLNANNASNAKSRPCAHVAHAMHPHGSFVMGQVTGNSDRDFALAKASIQWGGVVSMGPERVLPKHPLRG